MDCRRDEGRAGLQVARAAGALRTWHTVYMRLNRWSKRGVLERELAAAALDSTIIKLHLLARDDRGALALALSPGQAATASAGRELLERHGPREDGPALLMDRAYKDDATRELVLGWQPVVPPKRNRRQPWHYDRALYKRRNQVERLFRWLKRFRRIATRYDKLDAIFLAFIHLALIFDALPVA